MEDTKAVSRAEEAATPIPPESAYREGDRAVKAWFIFAMLWFPVFTTFGLILAIKFFYPTFMTGSFWDTFGRIRPDHVNGVLFGFVSSGLLGGMFYIVPRLCARPLYHARLALLAPIIWNLAVIGGITGILFGQSQGREYAELPFWADVLVMVGLLLNAAIVWGTVLKRVEKKLYVSLWYFLGTVTWFPIVYFIGNVMWHPATGALSGMTDGIFNWYYGHNVLGLWFTTLGIPIMYYFIPKLINRPLYSHLLSLVGFFTIAFFYTGVGGHHLLQAPIAEWLKTIAVVMTVLMSVPVLAFLANIGLTMRGAWHNLAKSTVLQFLSFGFVAYVLVSFQGTLQGLRATNAFLHFSQWTVGHSHLALLGSFGFIAVGIIYLLLPRLSGRALYSNFLMRLSWWVIFGGFFFFFWAMLVAGLVQNSQWWVHINVLESLPTLRGVYLWRAVTGGVVVAGAYLFAWNAFATLWHRRPFPEEAPVAPLPTAVPPSPVTAKDYSRPQQQSQERLSVPVIVGGGLGGFLVMTFMVVFMPYMYASAAPSLRAHELTPLETEGQSLYRSLGCVYCHNQFIRPQDWAMGYTSQPGDFYYSVPNFLGTERTGPALGQIGGKRPTEWHIFHHHDPRSLDPRSIMPSFAFLSISQSEAMAAYLQTLGAEDLDPNGFQSPVPYEFRFKENPYLGLLQQVAAAYDAESQTYRGPADMGQQWAAVYDSGKTLYDQKCLSCHGASGNGQGPYARQTLAHPANLNERIGNFPGPSPQAYEFWRIHEGVPGTTMPPWGWTQSEDVVWRLATYALTFVTGVPRTIAGDVSDAEGDDYDATEHPKPIIAGTQGDYQQGQALYTLYCAQCHGGDGHGDGPASSTVPGGYIRPEPANFEESGSDFTNYGRWVWKVREGVETTNMPPWKVALSDTEIALVIFYEQGFSTPEDYHAKWAPLYRDPFAQDLRR